MKSRFWQVLLIVAVAVTSFGAGYWIKSIPPTVIVTQYVATGDRVVIDNRYYPPQMNTYREFGSDYCEVPMSGVKLGDLPIAVQQLVPKFCDMNYVSIWKSADGTLYIKLRLQTGYYNGTKKMQKEAPELLKLLNEKKLLISFSFQGYQVADSISFGKSVPFDRAVNSAYGGMSHDEPIWYVESVWFKIK